MDPRQIWNDVPPPLSTATSTTIHCTPFTLPSNGVLVFGTSSLTLPTDAVFQPECTGAADVTITSIDQSEITDLRDPFYASTLPQCYVLAATTVIAYMLMIMLIIAPRTFLSEGAVILGRRGFTNGPTGGDGGINIGGRPWLQKVATLTVVISLTIASADTFRVAEQQYNLGYMDATALQDEVENGLELRIIQVISDTIVWLAQAQTLIRLFPRQREKIIIKWTGFALIGLDTLFSILNNFVYYGPSRPRSYTDAIPALSYLFQLALGLLYCAWVLYYSFTKRRYAYYHPQMPNMCLVAFLSILSVLVPVVFFVLDISQPDLAGWGDYVRWVGACAASVLVWEWVERIELLERNERKDGVLGREVFDGDEMLDISSTSDVYWSRRSRRPFGSDRAGTTTGITNPWPTLTGIAHRYRTKVFDRPPRDDDGEKGPAASGGTAAAKSHWPARPAPAATPVSRTDTASAESTLYAVRYHPISESTPAPQPNSMPARSASRTSHMSNPSPDQPDALDGRGDDARTHLRGTSAQVASPSTAAAAVPPLPVPLPSDLTSPDAHGRNPFRKLGHFFAHIRRDEHEHFPGGGANEDRQLQVIVVPPPVRRRLEVVEETERAHGERTDVPGPGAAAQDSLWHRDDPSTPPHEFTAATGPFSAEETSSQNHDRYTRPPQAGDS